MGESDKERDNRELIELLNELRVALPGVQVLFAFLLTIPFARGWATVTPLQKDVFFAGFMATTASSAFLIAPSSYHRLRFRAHDKEQLLQTANRMAIAGLGLLAVAIACVVFLISDYVFDATVAVPMTALATLGYAWLWYGLPLVRRAREEGRPDG